MAISTSISRLTDYYSRHGFGATIRRASLAAKRALFSSRMVVFYCDLAKQTAASVSIPSSLKVDRVRSHAELDQRDLQEMTSFWNPKQAHRNIRERFDQGASLWLIKSGDKLAGYGWTLQGRSIESYYFPLAPNDVHLFDFHVFPQYRGQGINPVLVTHILRSLGADRGGRAFIEAAEWNQAQLLSLRKTAFLQLGLVRSFKMLGHAFASWVENEAVIQMQKDIERKDRASSVARSHEQ
jgi:ribosomal protein S18 acetylase RimI-like enzyme